jgi:S1-C subfamily serine protease
VNLLDIVLLGVAASAVVGGYRLGFLTRTASWVGLGVGLLAAARTLPWLLEQFPDSSPAELFAFSGVYLLGASFVGQALGLLVGGRLRIRLPGGEWSGVDRVLGAVAGGVGVAVAFWLLLPTMAHSPGLLADQARNSVVARSIDRVFPPSPDTLVALRRLVGDDQFPQVFDALRPAPDIGPPPADSGLDGSVMARVAPSTVKISGVACDRVQEGSGFVAVGDDIVVTNAHVVAGQDLTHVERDDGVVLDAEVVAFDPQRDLAVLRVDGLGRPSLAVEDGGRGSSGGVFGRPGGVPLRVAPFVVGDEVRAVGNDIYDSRRTERAVLVLASELSPGDSGAALVDRRGTVVGVAFAIAPDDPDVAYALDTQEVSAVLDGDLSTPVDTGPCLR